MPPPNLTTPTPAGSDTGYEPILPLLEQVDAGGAVDTQGEDPYAGGPTTEDNPNAITGQADNGLAPLKTLASGAVDVAQGAAAGAIKGIKNTAKVAAEFSPTAQAVKTISGTDVAAKAIDAVPEIAAPTTVAGTLADGASQFAIGMIGVGKFAKAIGFLQKVPKLVAVGRTVLEGGAAQAVAFDPHEARMSNMLEAYTEAHPSLANPITEYLAAKPEDTEAEGRFKNFLEGSMMTAGAETLFSAVRGLKKIRLARETGGEEAAAKASIEVSDELEAMQSKAPEAAGDTPLPPSPPKDGGSADTAPPVEPKKSPEALAQSDADSIAAELLGHNEFPVDRITGLLNHENIEAPGYARQALELTAEKLAPQIKDKVGGVQTWEATREIADAMGEQPEALSAGLAKLAQDTDKQAGLVFAARQRMTGLAKAIADESRALDNGVKTDRSTHTALVKQLGDIMDLLLPVRTAQARGTRQWGMMSDGAMSMAQIKALVASGGDLKAVASILRPPSIATRSLNAFIEYSINAMLSGPKTHLVNATTNMIQMGARPLEKIIGGDFKYGLDEFMGQARAIKDSISVAARAFKLEESVLDPRLMKTEGPRHAISGDAFGFKPNSTMGAMTDFIGKVVRLPTRALISADEFFKQMNYRANVYAQATREGTSKGLSGSDLAQYMEDRFESAFTDKGAGLDNAAMHEARLNTFTEDLHPTSLAQSYTTAVGKHPYMRLITPFIRTPTNLIKQVGWHTPGVNLAMKTYRAELAAGGTRAAAARGMWATGGALWAGALTLCLQGKITGRGPANVDEKKAKLATGWRPYSFKVGDTYVDFSRFDPFGMVFGLAADMAEGVGHMKQQDHENMAVAMGAAMMRNLTSKTYLQGISQAIDAASQPDKKFQSWINSRAGALVPTGLKPVTSLVTGGDDTMREVRSAMDAMMARTPGLSEHLDPVRNLLGEPIHYPPALGPDSCSPFAFSKDLSDPVKTELARLSYGFKMPSEKIGSKGAIDLTKYKNDKGQDAYDRLLELRTIERKGRYTLKDRLAAEIESPRYKELPDGNDQYTSKKLDKVQQILGEYHEVTMRRLRKEYPQLDHDIRTDEHNVKVVKRQGVDALTPLLGQQ